MITTEIDCIIQARLNSERLPEKIFLELNNKSILKHIIDRVKKSKYVRNIIIATNDFSYERIKDHLSLKNVKSLESLEKEYNNVIVFKGSDENVLERYYLCAKEYNSKIICRVCADSPYVDIEYLDKAIEEHIFKNVDLSHFLGIPKGTGAEVINFNAIKIAYKSTRDKYEKEHVTPFLYKHRGHFNIHEPVCKPEHYYPNINVSIDYLHDYKYVKNIYDFYGKEDICISIEDIINYYLVTGKSN
ncbi:MAG: hypothetical protein JXM74_05845, partial [Fusobacteriaceae bacterium]|nr:hypothetical protein [Fusobacteriaceae bacterium]